jgi:chemotaxis protein methyltransferase CheR
VNDAAVEEFRTLLSSRFGWRLEDDRGQLAQVFTSRLGLHQSPHAYLTQLAQAPPSSPEVRALAETLAVSETYFFRNPEQFAVLSEVALPTLAARRPAGPIRILSAGAASGEEAYSIAITVLKRGAEQPMPPVEILGLDVSRRALDKARRGRYSAWALRGLPLSLKKEFFQHDGQHFDIARHVAGMVQFREWNLLDLSTGAPGMWDIVFFRNTFMYFTVDVARAIFAQLSRAMAPGAFLFLGHAETLRSISEDFALRHSHQTFYYVREPASAHGAIAPPLPDPATAGPAASAPVAAGGHPSGARDDWFHEIARATDRVAALVDGPRPAGPPPEAAARDARAAARREAGRGRDCATCMADALALVAQERYEAALEVLGEGSEPERLLLRAVLLANLGRLDAAREACRAVLAVDSLHAGAYYVQALCEERARNDTQAVRHDEMAIYLDDTFAMPHLHLALLARRHGERAAALEHTRRARDLFHGEDSHRILLFGGGFTRQALIQLCDGQMRALAS